MLAQEIIRTKRQKGTLTPAQIQSFVQGLTDESWSEGQVAALAMAIFLNGMQRDEAVALTLAMRDSGRVMHWPDMPGPIVRQAFDRRRRRQDLADVGPDDRRLWRLRADDRRPRPGPYRRHGGQARSLARLPDSPGRRDL